MRETCDLAEANSGKQNPPPVRVPGWRQQPAPAYEQGCVEAADLCLPLSIAAPSPDYTARQHQQSLIPTVGVSLSSKALAYWIVSSRWHGHAHLLSMPAGFPCEVITDFRDAWKVGEVPVSPAPTTELPTSGSGPGQLTATTPKS